MQVSRGRPSRAGSSSGSTMRRARACAVTKTPRSRAAAPFVVAARAHANNNTATATPSDPAAAAVAPSRREWMVGAGGAALAAAVAAPAAAPPAAVAAGAPAAPLPLVPKAALTPNLSVSQVIKGCWQLSGGHRGDRATDRTGGPEAVADFKAFYDAGITTADCADHYGPAEVLVGRFLASEPGLRESCQVATKYCVFSGQEMAGVSAASVRRAVDRSRQRLGVGQIDLLQFYRGSYEVPRYVDAALYLMDLKAEGWIKEIGVTNFDVPRLDAMRRAGVDVASNQVGYSLIDRRPAVAMEGYCADAGVKLLPYGVLAGSFLTDKYLGVDGRDVKADTYSKSKYSAVLVESAGGWGGLQRLLRGLKPIADKHATTIANVAARWVLQQPCVPAIILGARNAAHVDDHRRLFTFSLDESDLTAIDGLLAATKAPRGDCYAWERGGTF